MLGCAYCGWKGMLAAAELTFSCIPSRTVGSEDLDYVISCAEGDNEV